MRVGTETKRSRGIAGMMELTDRAIYLGSLNLVGRRL
jgi:hypothetical protein